jgi:hypothetical protein
MARPRLSDEEKWRRGTYRTPRDRSKAALAKAGKRPLTAVAGVAPLTPADVGLSPLAALDRVLDSWTQYRPSDLVAVVLLRQQLERRAELEAAVASGGATRNDLLNIEKEIAKGLAMLAQVVSMEVREPTMLERMQARHNDNRPA